MHSEETVIDEVLCWRRSPYEDWIPFTREALTTALLAERRQTNELRTLIVQTKADLQRIRDLLANELARLE